MKYIYNLPLDLTEDEYHDVLTLVSTVCWPHDQMVFLNGEYGDNEIDVTVSPSPFCYPLTGKQAQSLLLMLQQFVDNFMDSTDTVRMSTAKSKQWGASEE